MQLTRKQEIGIALGVTGLITFAYLKRKKITPGSGAKTNQGYLDTLHPKYKKRFVDFVNHLIRLGYKVQINSAYRDFYKQSVLKKQDKRNATPGFSPHNYGMALDLQVVNKFGKTFGKNTPLKEWINTGIPNLAKSYGLDWGGTIPGYPDAVHFSVAGINTKDLEKLAFKQFHTTDPAKIIGNRVMLSERPLNRSCGCYRYPCYCTEEGRRLLRAA